MRTKLDIVKLCLTGWANQMAARFGAPVYLVGSILGVDSTPRDIDVRIVFSDEEFEKRYGNAITWQEEGWTLWGEGRRRWGEDMAKLSKHAIEIGTFSAWQHKLTKEDTGGFNLDFQVQPECIFLACWKDKAKERLDTLDFGPRPEVVPPVHRKTCHLLTYGAGPGICDCGADVEYNKRLEASRPPTEADLLREQVVELQKTVISLEKERERIRHEADEYLSDLRKVAAELEQLRAAPGRSGLASDPSKRVCRCEPGKTICMSCRMLGPTKEQREEQALLKKADPFGNPDDEARAFSEKAMAKALEKHGPALVAAAKKIPVCTTCNDTHEMSWSEDGSGRMVPCNFCPVPCEKCRVHLGAYCQKTPCDCACHANRARYTAYDKRLREAQWPDGECGKVKHTDGCAQCHYIYDMDQRRKE